MLPSPRRQTPLVVVCSADSVLANTAAERLRGEGAVVYITQSALGCLRVATAAGPDMILLDEHFPGHVKSLLKSHPSTASAHVAALTENAALGWSPAAPVELVGRHGGRGQTTAGAPSPWKRLLAPGRACVRELRGCLTERRTARCPEAAPVGGHVRA